MNKKTIDPTSSPWAPFGIQLRRSREAAGLKQHQLARLCECSSSHLSFIELARRPPSRKLAELADKALNTGGTLMLLWWSMKNSAFLEGFTEYAGYEAIADEIRIFEIDVIPGLLQTRAYMTAIHLGSVRQGSTTPEEAEEHLAFRVTRQQVLERTPPALVHAVMDESCIRRVIGGRDVMVEQLLHLEQLAEQPNVIIQIAPHSMGENRPFTRVIHLLTMPNRKVLSYGEIEQRGYIERDSQAVTRLAKGYDRLAVEALGQADSLTLIRSARRDLEWLSN